MVLDLAFAQGFLRDAALLDFSLEEPGIKITATPATASMTGHHELMPPRNPAPILCCK
jgi:hypothetical protein